MSKDILPDSRARVVRGSVRSPHGNLVPVHCANCGKPWGMVNEKDMTFAFALCTPCSEVFGDDAHFYSEPDEVFWARAAEAMAEHKVTTPEEVAAKIESGANSLTTLANDWQQYLRKTT